MYEDGKCALVCYMYNIKKNKKARTSFREMRCISTLLRLWLLISKIFMNEVRELNETPIHIEYRSS